MALKPVVVGTDGSERSVQAVDWAAREAAMRDLPLQIVSVIPRRPSIDWFTSPDQLTPMLRQTTEEALEAAAESANMTAPGVTVDTSLLTGEPGPVLADRAERASMLVVGSHGAGGVAAKALGSVSGYLAAHATCPVVIDRGVPAPACQQILVGVRNLDDSETPLAFAFEEAAHRGAHLVVVQAWYRIRSPGAHRAAITPAQASAEALIRLHQLIERWRDKYPDVQAGEEIIHDDPHRALVGLSALADLLVLGRRPGRIANTDTPLGSVTSALLHRAQCPVTVVPAHLESCTLNPRVRR